MSSEKYSIFGNNKINPSEIFRKWMIQLKINFTTGDERRIGNAVCIRPLKNIRLAPIFVQIWMMAAKLNTFKGLEYKNLFYFVTIASRYLSQKHPVLQADYRAS
jgi:hypothetical protein